ncbi:MAG: hypothetical protein HYV04_06550 [Deltaproteobacteria bacterium]|nr:hypothetical protein [Deltaproteobacteria bacterium]
MANQGAHESGPAAANGPVALKHCPSRFQRARTGGFVGGVFGTVAAALTGSFIVGGVYKLAGYMTGFVSTDNCTEQGFVIERVGPVEAAEPPGPPDPIHEEALTVSARP